MTTERLGIAGKRSTPEQIVAKPLQMEVLSARGKPVAETVRAIRVAEAENQIKAWNLHLAAGRASCSRATANQFRLLLHAGAY